ncbi:copper resistance protein CopC [Planosporangium flavigriseum]|uniref:CopC domain-containing protein n=1 Tax=Planosporangium flavigriseum TaxID=373681 RepID=A0A8J3LN58_9ACTN|nr:copper resistance protein CopC [Planosporangium flavigriseum]NJC65749.1 copper resistance protein CopC [Planosporangium flavigriseum]GIG73603.1 hypothetical protein Pfl04_20070 [Planosporangium flavigriseum]
MRRLLTILMLAAGMLTVPAPASAHSGLVSASPGPGDKIAPGAQAVALTFGPLRDQGPHRVSVSGPDDKPVASGQPVLVDGSTLCLSVTALQRPGVYAVSYSTVARDGDAQQSKFYFQVVESGGRVADAAACQGHRLPSPTIQAQQHASSNRILTIVFCTILLIKAGATVAIVRVMRKRRRRTADIG